jgi:hypothetical protein
MIIARPLEKIKSWGRGPVPTRILPILAIILYGAAMFGLGISTHLTAPASPVVQVTYDPSLDSQLEYKPQGSTAPGNSTGSKSTQSGAVSGTAQKTFSLDANFVASVSGTKYYPVDCGSVSRIKEENRVYFVTDEEAQAAGLDRTTACK